MLRTAAGLLLFALAGIAPSASASPSEGSLTYSCLMAQQNLEALATPVELVATLRLDVPPGASPGDQLAPEGTFSVVLPEAQRQLVALAAADLQLRTALLALRAHGGADPAALTTGWTSSATPTSAGPLTMTGPVRLPGFPAPDTDEVRFMLPDQNVLTPVLGDQPVALNLEATGAGHFGGSSTYFFSCTAPEGADATAARVPVVAQPATEPTTGPPASDAPQEPPPQVDLPPADVLPVAPPQPLTSAPTAPAVPPAVVPLTSTAELDWTVAPSAESADGVLIKPSTLGVVTLLLTATALSHAAWSARRLRFLRGRAPAARL
jgi:hypothetical protein